MKESCFFSDSQSVNSENSSSFEFVSSEKSESFSSKTCIVALASHSADSIFRYEHWSTPASGFFIFVSLYSLNESHQRQSPIKINNLEEASRDCVG